MNVEIVKAIPIDEAFAAIRSVPLEAAGDKEVFFYRDADIRLAKFHPEELNPVALYLLEENLKTQRKLRAHLLDNFGIDIFMLDCVLHLKTDSGLVGMIPPYVELSTEAVEIKPVYCDVKCPSAALLRVPLVIDGLHRVYLARLLGEEISCITVRSPYSLLYPPASYPVSWTSVQVYNEVPKVKKHYRRKDPYTFMRPLDALRMLPTNTQEYGR